MSPVHAVPKWTVSACPYIRHGTTTNTAYIERLNLAIRQSVAYLRRRSPTHTRWERRLYRQLELARYHYNFIRLQPACGSVGSFARWPWWPGSATGHVVSKMS